MLSEAEAASKVEAELREQISKAIELDVFKPKTKDSETSGSSKTLSNKSSSDTATPKGQESSSGSTFDRIDEFAALLNSLS